MANFMCKLSLGVVFLSWTVAFGLQATPGFQPSAFPVDAGTTMVGGLVNSRELTILNSGTATLNISSAAISGSEFSFAPGSPPLPIAVAPGASTPPFVIVFSPAGPGQRSGTLTVQDNAPGNPHTIGLAGFGVTVAAGDFAVLAPGNIPTSTSIPAGATADFDLVATGGPNNLALACSGMPADRITCSVPPSLTLPVASVGGSDSSVPVHVTIGTTAPNAANRVPRFDVWFALALALLVAGVIGRKQGIHAAMLMAAIAAMVASTATCGSGKPSSTPPGTYNLVLTVTGNNSVVHTVTLTVGVRPAGSP